MPDLKDPVFKKLAKKVGFPSKKDLARLEKLQGERSLFRAAQDEGVLDEQQLHRLEAIARKLAKRKKAKKAKRRERERAEAGRKKSRAARETSSGTLTIVKPPVEAEVDVEARAHSKGAAAKAKKSAETTKTPKTAKTTKAPKTAPIRAVSPAAAGSSPSRTRSRLAIAGGAAALVAALAGGYLAFGRSSSPPTAPSLASSAAAADDSASTPAAAVATAPAPAATAPAPATTAPAPTAATPAPATTAPAPAATAPAAPAPAPAAPAPAPAVVEKPIAVDGWKLRVPTTGLVSIALASLPERASSALDRAGAALVLTSNGKPVPYLLADDGALVFRAEADPTTRDERGRCYRLHVAGAGEKPNRVDASGAPAASPVSVLVTLFPEEPRRYDALPAYDLATVSSGAKTGGYWFHPARLTFKLPRAAEPRPATLRLSGIFVRQTRPAGNDVERLAGTKNRDPGKVTVRVGGKKLGAVALGKHLPEGDDLELAVPASALAAGELAVELASEPKGPTSGIVLVQRASLECALVAEPSAATPPVTSIPASELEPCRRSDLRETAGADWLAIAPRALVAAVAPLAEHRTKTGLVAKVVALEDVEDAFADGAFGPEGIRAFLAFTQESWKKRPRFVLLVGDAYHDGRPKDAQGAVLPTALVDSFENGATASDFALAPAGVAIGRFPVRTEEETSALVAKTIAYESAPSGAWQKQLAFVCGEGHFGDGADAMIENLFTQAVSKRVPEGLDVDVTYGNPGSVFFYPPDKFSDRVTERLSQGALIVNYVGHGGPESFDDVYWGQKRYPIFARADAERVACEGARHPIVLITACLTGAFDRAERTVGEALVLNPRGAVAVFAASRESSPITNALLSLELTSRLFKQAGEVEKAARPRLGERLRAALDELSVSSGEEEGKAVTGFARMAGGGDAALEQLVRDGRAVYNLLGDPALEIQYARTVKLTAPEDAQAGKTIEVELEHGAEGIAIERVTLERRRQPPKGLTGLPETTSPDSLTSADVRKKILETYGKANDFVVLEGKVEGSKARLVLPRDLAHGTYVIKVWSSQGGGALASSPIAIDDADDEEEKPKPGK